MHRKLQYLLPVLLALLILFTACADKHGSGVPSGGNTGNSQSNNSRPSSGNNFASSGNSGSDSANLSNTDADMFTDRDLDDSYSDSNSIAITLSGTSATCTGNNVQIKGNTITITGGGTYVLSGSFHGMVVINAKDTDKPQLVLNNAHITSDTSAALYILECAKTIITLAPNSQNTLTNGGSFTPIDDNNIDGAIYSKQDLSINGEGSLSVSSPAGHGIVCKDDLVVTGGELSVTSASHGLDANDSVRIIGTTMKLDAGKDGIHAENSDDSSLGFVYISGGTLDIEAEGDGISAGSTIQITDGIFSMITGGGSENASHSTSDGWGNMGGMGGPGGMGGGRPRSTTTSEDDSTSIKGLKSSGAMAISGGNFTIDSADDAVHSNASIAVTGGSFTIASGDDGFHADDTLTFQGGTVDISESYEGLEGLHIRIADGDISLISSDDGLNAAGGTDSSGTGGFRGDDMFGGMGGHGGMSTGNGSITISGGCLYIQASGDGIDANGTLSISGGHTVVTGPTQGDTAVLDYDKTAIITGGTFIGTGSTMMAQVFSDGSTQGYFAVQGSSSAGTTLTLTDSSGKTVLEHTPTLNYSLIILSSPDIISGQSYTITLSNGASGTFNAY